MTLLTLTNIKQIFVQFGRIYRHWPRRRRLFALGMANLLAFCLFVYVWLLWDLPRLSALEAGQRLPSTRLYDRHGALLYEIVDLYGGSQRPIALADLPPCMAQATIATEDANFYQHAGVDVAGIARALWLNLRGGEVRAGGSTITQQVARTLLLKDEMSERSLRRKAREALLALMLGATRSKDDILELYLNQTYYGSLAYGVEAAAYTYFGTSARQLSLAQCALLAGLPQTPALYNPLTDPDAAKARQAVVLGLMVKTGYISPAQADLAIAEPLTFSAQAFPIKAPHFVAAVWTQLERDYPAALREGGLVVTTTLDLSWQRTAEAVTRQQLERLNQPRDGSPSKNVNNAALVALDPHTGEILALLGSPDYFNAEIDGAVNAALAYRQPGSALKPFTYAASFDPQKTGAWTPATMLLDISTPFVTRRLESYTPANYGLVEHGPVSIREALANSYNIPAVITLDHIGLPAFVALTTRLGLSTLTDTSRLDLSVTLGGGEVRLMDLTAAYAAFANGGQARRPVYIREVRRATGELLYQWTPPPADLPELDPRVAFLITSILSDEAARLPSFGAGSALSLGSRPAAAKTGTTTDFRDNWTVGYTPQVVVGVWVGNADNTPMRDVTGVTGAAPIWNQFIRAVLNGQPELPFSVPDGLIRAEVCALSGLLPTPDCPQRRWEWFIEGTVPTQPDNLYQAFEIDKRTGQLADDSTPPAYRERRVYLVLPPEARAWAKAQGIPEPPVGTQIVSDADAPLRLLAPDPYTVFQLSPHLPLEYQRIRLSVSQLSTLARVVYRLDGVILAEVDSPPFEVWWALTPGEHELQAEASLTTGESLRSPSVPFRVNSWVPPGERPSHGEAE